jgi:tetratricopeptide (TPR) repeat protein
MVVKDFYKLLNVDPGIPLEELKSVMFKKRKEKTTHAASAPTPERRREAEDFLHSLDEARKVFENESTRMAYDRQLADYKKQTEAEFENYEKKETDESSRPDTSFDPRTALEDAMKAVSEKNYTKAVPLLQKIINVMPENLTARKMLVGVYCEMGTDLAMSAALKELAFLEIVNSQDFETYFYAGLIYKKGNDWEKATNAFANACRLDPNDVRAPYELAGVYSQTANIDGAINVYKDLLGRIFNHNMTVDEANMIDEEEIKFELASCYGMKAFDELFTVVPENHPSGLEPGFYVTERSQLERGQYYIDLIKGVCSDHPSVADIQANLDLAMNRKFVGVLRVPVIAVGLGVVGLLAGGGDAVAMVLYMFVSAALYYFGSMQRQYIINHRILIEDMQSGLARSLQWVSQQEGWIPWIGLIFILMFLPIIGLYNLADNYFIKEKAF